MSMLTVMKTSSVRRRLFGPVDQEQLHEDFEKAQRESARNFMNKWNFDPLHDRPCEGTFEWTPLDSATVPAFYLKGYSHQCRKRTRLDEDLPRVKRRRLVFTDDEYDGVPETENSSLGDPPSSSSSPSLSTSSASPTSASDLDATPSGKRQTVIPDYMKRRKRPSQEKPPRV